MAAQNGIEIYPVHIPWECNLRQGNFLAAVPIDAWQGDPGLREALAFKINDENVAYAILCRASIAKQLGIFFDKAGNVLTVCARPPLKGVINLGNVERGGAGADPVKYLVDQDGSWLIRRKHDHYRHRPILSDPLVVQKDSRRVDVAIWGVDHEISNQLVAFKLRTYNDQTALTDTVIEAADMLRTIDDRLPITMLE